MSILIKGMDKPTDCGLCPFEDFGYCNVKGERNTSESGIDTDCPLIEVADRKDEPQTDEEYINNLPWVEVGNGEQTDEPQTERKCIDCKFLTYRFNKVWCDIKCDNPHDKACDRYKPKDEPQTDTEIAKAIVHKMIDDAVIAEDVYPDLRQKMHDAVDEYEPQTCEECEHWNDTEDGCADRHGCKIDCAWR